MASQLARLLGRTDIKFDIAIKDLEKATGKTNIDVKIVGDVLAKAHKTIRALGLDNKDVTALELYKALQANKDRKILRDTAYVGIFLEGKLISLNHEDVDFDKIHKLSFSKRTMETMRTALANEVVKRYKDLNRSNPRNIGTILREIQTSPPTPKT